MPPKLKKSDSAGYSGKQLWQKLGYKDGLTVLTVNAPASYVNMLGDSLPKLRLVKSTNGPVFAVHLFVTSHETCTVTLTALRKQIDQTGMVWVSWPKKTSKICGDIDENVIRSVALPLGFVDIKVCAVDSDWSGLKLVIRKTERT